MNIRSNIKPELINYKIIKKLTKDLKKPSMSGPSWKENILIFYSDYIRPNLFALIVMIFVTIYLTVKYLIKQDTENQLKKRKRQKLNKIKKKSKTDLTPITLNNNNNIKNKQNQIKKIMYEDDEEIRNDDEVSYYSLSKEYEKQIDENDGSITEMMLKDNLEQKRQRMTFDEMAKMIIGE